MAERTGHLRPTDAELIQAARGGDQAAFHALVDRHAHALYGLAASLSDNAADAEDIVQETFAGAFWGLGGFRGQASVKTWLTRILVRQAARHRRYAGRRQATFRGLEAAVDADLGVPSADGATDARIDVKAAMRLLSPDHRDVIALREFQGLSYDEIAEVLEIPRGTVESRLFRARRELQGQLKEYLG